MINTSTMGPKESSRTADTNRFSSLAIMIPGHRIISFQYSTPSPHMSNMEDGLVLQKCVDRTRLDFDFEKICSVTLKQDNVHVCLKCGKYFHGRQANSPAQHHSLANPDHFLFMNLSNKSVYMLPDDIELSTDDLDDIKYNIYPTFTVEAINYLDSNGVEGVDLHGRKFHTGFIGINNIKANNYANVVLHLLLHVNPIRDFLLLTDLRLANAPLLRVLSECARKVWNPRQFKGLLSPHEYMQTVNIASGRRFSLNYPSDCSDFLNWILNALDAELKKDSNSPNLMEQNLRGKVCIYEKKLPQSEDNVDVKSSNIPFTSKSCPFWLLSFDLPPTPLFRTLTGEYVTPQIELYALLKKFNGTDIEQKGNVIHAFSINRIPPFLILKYNRFTKSHLVMEKNTTLIMHPVKGVQFPSSDAPYDLIANICHHGDAELGKGSYSIQLLNQATGKWYEITDILVQEIPAVNIPLSESYIQVWQRR